MPIWKMKRRFIRPKRPFRKIKRRFANVETPFYNYLFCKWFAKYSTHLY